MRGMKSLGRRMILLALCLFCASAGYAGSSAENAASLYIRVGDAVLTARLADNSSARALTELLSAGDITIDMHDYGNFEKVGDLPASLPRNDEAITTQAGDLILYQGNRFVLYYDVNSWDFTRLGWVEGVTRDELISLLGAGNVTATLSLTKPPEADAKGAPSAFDFSTRSVRLNDGRLMPILGLGTWTLDDEAAENSVYHALKDGYRLIDTAAYYGNQKGVGNGVRKAIAEGVVTREEVFVTTKIAPWGMDGYAEEIAACNEALGLGYIDLMLIHQRGVGEKALYAAIEDAIDVGIVRTLGISNYYTAQAFDDITDGARYLPAVIQNENHPFYQNTALQEYVGAYGTIVESHYPFGGRGHTAELFGHQTILAIAKAHGKTSAQVLARWHLQAGYIAIPGSSNVEHIAENFDVFDFSLTDAEMAAIAAMNTGKRYENW